MAFALLTHVQNDAAAAPLTSSAINTTGATVIVVTVGTGGTGITASFITDSQSNRYYMASSIATDATHFDYMFVCLNPSTSAAHTFTVASGSFPSLCVACWSGTPGALLTSTIASTAGAFTIVLPTITPTNTGALLVTGAVSGSTGTFSINSGFTITDQGGGTNGEQTGLAYLIQSPAAAVGPTWTESSSRSFCGTMIAIELAGGAAASSGGSFPYCG